MPKKYIYLLAFLITSLILATLYFKSSKTSGLINIMQYDFLIDNLSIMSTIDYMGDPENTDEDKFFLQSPGIKTEFTIIGETAPSLFFWKIFSDNIDTAIFDVSKLEFEFKIEGKYLVSLCKNQSDCISKWVFIENDLNEEELTDDLIAHNDQRENNNVLDESQEVVIDLYTRLKVLEEQLDSLPQIYPHITQNQEYLDLKSETSDLMDLLSDIYDFRSNRFTAKTTEVPTVLEALKMNCFMLERRINNFIELLSKDPKKAVATITIDSTPEKTEDTDITCKSKIQIGFRTSERQPANIGHSISGILNIKPSRNIRLFSAIVFSTDVGNLFLELKGDDGTAETMNFRLNPGQNQILMSEFYAILRKDVNYSVIGKIGSSRSGINPQLENAGKNTKKDYSDTNVSIKFANQVFLANLIYCFE